MNKEGNAAKLRRESYAHTLSSQYKNVQEGGEYDKEKETSVDKVVRNIIMNSSTPEEGLKQAMALLQGGAEQMNRYVSERANANIELQSFENANVENSLNLLNEMKNISKVMENTGSYEMYQQFQEALSGVGDGEYLNQIKDFGGDYNAQKSISERTYLNRNSEFSSFNENRYNSDLLELDFFRSGNAREGINGASAIDSLIKASTGIQNVQATIIAQKLYEREKLTEDPMLSHGEDSFKLLRGLLSRKTGSIETPFGVYEYSYKDKNLPDYILLGERGMGSGHTAKNGDMYDDRLTSIEMDGNGNIRIKEFNRFNTNGSQLYPDIADGEYNVTNSVWHQKKYEKEGDQLFDQVRDQMRKNNKEIKNPEQLKQLAEQISEMLLNLRGENPNLEVQKMFKLYQALGFAESEKDNYFIGHVWADNKKFWEIPSYMKEYMTGILFHPGDDYWSWSKGCQTIYYQDYIQFMEVLGGTYDREYLKTNKKFKWEFDFNKKGKYFLWN